MIDYDDIDIVMLPNCKSMNVENIVVRMYTIDMAIYGRAKQLVLNEDVTTTVVMTIVKNR